MEGVNCIAVYNAWCLPEVKIEQTVILPTEYNGQREVRTFFKYKNQYPYCFFLFNVKLIAGKKNPRQSLVPEIIPALFYPIPMGFRSLYTP